VTGSSGTGTARSTTWWIYDERVLSAHVWTFVDERYADIIEHPFVSPLRDGSLSHETFVRSLVDDAHHELSHARRPVSQQCPMAPALHPWCKRCISPIQHAALSLRRRPQPASELPDGRLVSRRQQHHCEVTAHMPSQCRSLA